ncbi:MAG TPA: T9SS type A sorting domain-containing protein, partial [Ferruginibacter sp.]|nr:T9SS type A sorting domain-containing protein [Ferruginibacter sp.]
QALFGVMGGVRIRRTIVNEYKEAVNKTTDVVNNLKVYPNPASHGNSINLKMNLTETGLHQLQITDAGYRTVFYKRISVFNKQQEEQIVCDSKWAAGIYFIRIFDSKNSLVNESSFIVQ